MPNTTRPKKKFRVFFNYIQHSKGYVDIKANNYEHAQYKADHLQQAQIKKVDIVGNDIYVEEVEEL